MHACVCSNQCYKRGGLVCISSCLGCPALHCRTGPVPPGDDHSLAEGHQFLPNLTSNHRAICYCADQSRCSMLALLHGKSTLTRYKQCVCCMQSNLNLYVYTSFCELLLKY